ncbi:MAG: GntR family transcriptional regulator [Streptosporangiaceae bacterium]
MTPRHSLRSAADSRGYTAGAKSGRLRGSAQNRACLLVSRAIAARPGFPGRGAVARDGGITIASFQSAQGTAARLGTDSLRLPALAIEASLTSRAYDALREAIAEMPIYDGADDDIRLDERALAERLGISRTPVRAALQRLETEGVVQTIPRRGIYVVRKTKAEIIDVILASAALEGMAARLAAERASDAELQDLLDRFPAFRPGAGVPVREDEIDEYSATNLDFHQRIADLAHSELFSGQISRLKIHMRAIRQRTIGDDVRRRHSAADHAAIMAALCDRDADRAGEVVRRHATSLAEHVRDNVSYLR